MSARFPSTLPLCLACVSGYARARTAPSGGTLPTIEVCVTTPVSGSGIDPDKVPASVTHGDRRPDRPRSVAEHLRRAQPACRA